MQTTQDNAMSDIPPSAIPLRFALDPLETAVLAFEANTSAATVRVADEKGIAAGDLLAVIEASSETHVLTARVEHAIRVPAWRAMDLIRANGAEYGASDAKTLLRQLNQYYADVNPTDMVKVIIYRPERANTELPRPHEDPTE